MKFKVWNGRDLTGEWLITTKLDGVRAVVTEDAVLSRSVKLLPGLQSLVGRVEEGVYEFFYLDFNSSVSVARSNNHSVITDWLIASMYSLDYTKSSLALCKQTDPKVEAINYHFETAILRGYEGLVLYNKDEDTYLKVKSKYTDDVRVLDIIEGTNKNIGKLGAFLTTKGNVGIGFTDEQRKEYFDPKYIGSIIEVEYMNETAKGKLRMPRFKRLRDDKLEENLEATHQYNL